MKIGIVCYPTFGGSGVVACELGLSLAKEHEVHFISYACPARLETDNCRISYHRVDIPPYPLFEYSPYTLALASKIVDVIEHHHLDIIHVHYVIPHGASAYLAKKALAAKTKIIVTLHGTDVYLLGLDPSYKPIVEFSMESSDSLTAVSEFLRNETQKKFRITRPITVIPNFVDPEKYRRTSKDKEKTICHISNFRPLKRVADVVRIFGMIANDVNSKLYLIGEGPTRHPAQRLVEKLGLEEKVCFRGNLRDVSRILGKSDLFLLPSEQESFGLAALEAMSSEVPVVVTRVGGLPELVRHGKDGYLAEVGDLETMAEYCLKILTDESLAEKMGKQARMRVLEKFTTERVVPQYVSLYRRTLSS
ncbi:MAG: N-acetyl-alpha-D-glucosaminyl L-malate synthase BshA [bacterium]